MPHNGAMKTSPLTRQSIGLLIGLGLEYLVGMAVNMFVAFPDHGSEEQMWRFVRTQPLVILHILIGLGLLLGSIGVFVRATRQHDHTWQLPSFVAMIAILLGALAGSKFVPTQTEGYSYLMASTLLLAAAAYAWGIYRANKAGGASRA